MAMTSMLHTNTFMQKQDSNKNYLGWACVSGEGRIDRPFYGRGGIVESDMREVDE